MPDDLLGFVIPLTHPAAARDWASVVRRLEETLRSVESACRGQRAHVTLVANITAELPALPSCVEVVSIDLPPPPKSVFVGEGPEDERRAIKQLDKGRKVLAGAIQAASRGAEYLMFVDADDLISCRLPAFVEEHRGAAGWYVDEGWVLPMGNRVALRRGDFDAECGTSLVVRTDLLGLPDTTWGMDEDQVRRWFGSHKYLKTDLRVAGHPLAPLPFPGAVYRTGHGENNSAKGGLRPLYFRHYMFLADPIGFLARVGRLRYFGGGLRREFAGGLSPA